jgi:hypothetical protein
VMKIPVLIGVLLDVISHCAEKSQIQALEKEKKVT